ncbi:MAG: S8 family serine peptidase [Candidatus Pacearchaeota archaeon]
MEKKIFFFLFLLISLIGVSLISSKAENPKIEKKILEEKTGEKIKVIIELEDSVIEKGKFGVSSLKKVDKNFFIMQNEKIRKKIKHNFIYSNAFSAELSIEEIEELAKKPEVKKIHYDYPVRAFLQQSIPLINASPSWNLQVDGINLTGEGQTVCIIDTGVDYGHNDLGGCSPVKHTLEGTVEDYFLESPHPYPNNYDYTWTITKPGYEKIAVHFKNISLEYPGQEGYDSFDRIIVYDSQMRQIAVYHGINGVIEDLLSPYSEGDKIYIRLISDNGVNSYGFYIDKVINGTTNTTYNWNDCQKIFGGWDFVNNEGDPLDDNGHGTHVAGIVGASGTIKGVAPGAKIVAVKSLNSDGEGYSSDIIAGIEYCINKSQEFNISVISMSLGSDSLYNSYCNYGDDPMTKSINFAILKNISVVIATGNNENSSFIAYPACIYNATRVGSTTKSDEVSSFSNRWALEMLMAPGSSINSTYLNNNYVTMDGTSMATPHVSGAIAIIRQYLSMTNRTMTPKEIENLLNKTGKSISADGRTYKRVDLFSALLEIDATPPKINVSGIENNTKTFERNLTFNYSVSDWQLANVTLYLFNSTGLYKKETKNIEGTFNESYFYVKDISPGEYSWYIEVSDKKSNTERSEIKYFEILSKPIWCAFHFSHTNFSDGKMNITQQLLNIKEYYDCGSTNDHDTSLNQEEWEALINISREANEEFNFIYFFGVEWSGNQHIFYITLNPSQTIKKANDENFNEVKELSEWLKENKGVGQYNHPARKNGGTNFSNKESYDEEIIPLVEIINLNKGIPYWHWNYWWNCSNPSVCEDYINPTYDSSHLQEENGSGWVKYALDKGIHLGFSCGNDYHDSYPFNPKCYTGISELKELTRESILESLRKRHTWVGEDKIFMRFKFGNLSSNYTMGDKINYSSINSTIAFFFEVYAPEGENVSNVSLFSNGVITSIAKYEGKQNVSGKFFANLSEYNESYFFIETILTNGKRGWTSPIWVYFNKVYPPLDNKNSKSSGSGGGTSFSQKDILTEKESKEELLEKGFSKILNKGESLIFYLKTKHNLTVEDILNDSAKFILRSEPLSFTLYIGEEKKFNLSSSDYFDLSIKLNSIVDKKVNLTIKKINETIIKEEKEPTEKENNNYKEESFTKVIKEKKKINKKIFAIILPILFLLWFVFFYLLRKSLKETERDYKYEKIKVKPFSKR